ncbi:curlin [uncultured Lacinutrix sp.]|uniref:curlin n=1 Tax=uncultured Lacinutrix sp. TaxID=574032 RepID=UPI00260E1506|nr:curlin [uncultured Lacinutrix sp.]
MKKVIFGATALLFTGAMFAQVAQSDLKDVNGTNSQDASLATSFSSGGNFGEADQQGNGNQLQVRQAGAWQSTYSEQGDGLGTGGNKARIWQTGEVTPPPSGFANVSDVRQLGTENESTTYQEGDFNEAVTRQGLKDGGLSGGNRALIQHGTAGQGEYNFAMVEQDGQDNRSKTIQSFDNNEARTVQLGDNNRMSIRQKSGPNGTSGNSALAEQYGDDNHATTYQDGHDQEAHLVQTGDDNRANQIQEGNNNRGVVDQGQGLIDDTIAGLSGQVYLDVFADSDYSVGAGGSDSQAGKALQIQDGDDNQAYLGQFGSDGEASNYGEQNQVGDSNSASMNQNAFGTAAGGANYGRQDQDGDGNFAILGQNGRDHKAYQRQDGDSNFVISSQKGNANLVSTFQGGDFNVAITGQRGHDNQALVVQMSDNGAGHSFVSRQNVLDGGMPNGGNTIDVLQLGPDGDLNGTFPGCDFQPEVDINSPTGPASFDLDAPCGPGC